VLAPSIADRIASCFRFATGATPLDAWALEHDGAGTPARVVDELTDALTEGIESLSRPIDAIKHQAKTVTVGVSRTDEALWTEPLVREVLAAGAERDHLAWSDLRALAALGPAVRAVLGYSRYEVEDGVEPTIRQIDAGGIADGMPSRTADDPRLVGTKHQVARERRSLVARGRRDGRTVLIVPETVAGRTARLTLLHLDLEDHLPAAIATAVLDGYRGRLTALRDAVTETEADLASDRLEALSVLRLLTDPIAVLADEWRESRSRH
jgi:glucosamine--fructose-6-phosphate aminotransferase (isomerizing)